MATSNDDLDFEIKFFEGVLRQKADDIDTLIPLADAYTRRGLYSKGLELDERLAKLCPESDSVFYNLACSYSLLGRIDDSLKAITRSIQLGYDDFDHLLNDPDLSNLRKDPRFLPWYRELTRNQNS